MFVYRIALAKYANTLQASGRAARWNPNDLQMIYTASSRSLACLENVVHRSQLGLNMLFSMMIIEIPDTIKPAIITAKDLPKNWKEFPQIPITQALGEKWISGKSSVVLQVPSSIIDEEVNYLVNPLHPDFKLIRLIKTEPFTFDKRIKA